MAQKNIVVADGERFVLNPRAKDEGERTTLNAKVSAAVREHVQAYVEADSRDLPYSDLLKANKRVSMMQGNPLVDELRFITGIGAEEVVDPATELVAGEPSMEEIMAAAEQENARRDAMRQFILNSGKSERRQKALLKELGLV